MVAKRMVHCLAAWFDLDGGTSRLRVAIDNSAARQVFWTTLSFLPGIGVRFDRVACIQGVEVFEAVAVAADIPDTNVVDELIFGPKSRWGTGEVFPAAPTTISNDFLAEMMGEIEAVINPAVARTDLPGSPEISDATRPLDPGFVENSADLVRSAEGSCPPPGTRLVEALRVLLEGTERHLRLSKPPFAPGH